MTADDFPLRFGTPQEFAALRSGFVRAEFDEPTICRRLELDSLFRFRALRDGRPTGSELRDTLSVLIRLFLDAEPVPERTARSQLAADFVSALERFGLVEPRDAGGTRVLVARVWLYPIGDLRVASDLPADPLDPGAALRHDAVYPAITVNTQHFLSALPATTCDSLLEVCAGTGVAALQAASYAREVWAADVAHRAIKFAEFNARLNGLQHMRVVCGDVYEALGDRQFHRIVAHPPYIPADSTDFVYRAGGMDGEEVTRRVLGGLGKHLRPGGRFYGLAMITEREGAGLEDRLRHFLGDAAPGFDTVVGAIRTYTTTEMLGEFALDPRRSGTQLQQLCERFRALKVTSFVYGIVAIRRRELGERGRDSVTRRARSAASAGWAFDWALDVEAAVRAPGFRAALADQRPRARPDVRMHVVHRLENGAWSPADWRMQAEIPFDLETPCPDWVATLLARCDGSRTSRELFEGLKADALIPSVADVESFLELIERLSIWGVVAVAAVPEPRPGAPR